MTLHAVLPILLAQAFAEYVSMTEVTMGAREMIRGIRRTITDHPLETAVVVVVLLLIAWGVARMG